jgi:TetR/AcrR family transcriptional regulator, ethionamide resistance regulator
MTSSSFDRSYRSREARRRDFVSALEQLLADGRPFSEITVQQLADEVGLSRTGFYFHFGHTRDVLLAAATGAASDVYEAAALWLDVEDAGFDGLEAALARIAEAYRSHGPVLQAVCEAAAYDDAVRLERRQIIGRFIVATRRRLEGSTPGHSRGLQAAALVWMTERTLLEHVATDGDDPAPVSTALARTWWAALEDPAPRARTAQSETA